MGASSTEPLQLCELAGAAPLAALFADLPEFAGSVDAALVDQRLSGRPALLLGAFAGGVPVGFKAGYDDGDGVFYSWLGGVHPQWRRGGVATALLLAQEAWARAHGYRELRVKSMNRYPAMLALLIRQGYAVCGYQAPAAGDPFAGKILFGKRLPPG